MSDRITIKSIAKDLGISHMTVSRALSDHPNVNDKTRAAVQKRAAELGYVKSVAAKAMRGDGTQIIGLLLPNIVNEFYARFANTLAQACVHQGYHLIIHLTNDDVAQESRCIQRLLEVQAMAVLMVPAPGVFQGELKQLKSQLKSMKIIQLIRQRDWDLPAASILIDDSTAIHDAVVHVAAMGHQSIAYIGADVGLSSGHTRLEAFRSGLKTAGLAESKRLIHTGPPSFSMGGARAKKIVTDRSATAIVCGGVEISNGALATLLEHGDGQHSDIAFVGYGDPSFYAWIKGGVSSIAMPIEDLAHRAVQLLDDDQSDQTTALYPAQLIIRNGAN